MTVGSGEARKGGCVLLYRSHDLASWTYLHRLAGADWNGALPDDGGDMWECPEFFPLGNGHVLVYSTEGRAHWLAGTLDHATMVFHPHKQGVLDTGAFYAPKTQRDAYGERIAWGWIQETRPLAAFEAAGWAGMISLPRRLRLDADGALRVDIPAVTDRLRGKAITQATSKEGTSCVLPRANGEVVCTGTRASAFEIVIAAAGDELLRIAYSPDSHAMTVANRSITIANDDEPHVHLFVDGSVIEAIIGHREGYTKRFYLADAPDVSVAIRGKDTRTQAWAVEPT
jgi:beta-fructofuranosidase